MAQKIKKEIKIEETNLYKLIVAREKILKESYIWLVWAVKGKKTKEGENLLRNIIFTALLKGFLIKSKRS